jgi:hypothetical protein
MIDYQARARARAVEVENRAAEIHTLLLREHQPMELGLCAGVWLRVALWALRKAKREAL